MLQWSLSFVVIACWLAFAAIARNHVVRPLQTMANLLLALREGDYSFRARGAKYDDPLGEILAEINALGSVLQTQRRGAIEATALLRTVMEEIDVAVFAFDQDQVLRLVNRAGERLLAQPGERLLGRSAEAIGMANCLEGDPSRLLASTAFAGSHGRWGLRRSQFREDGRPHQLIVIADLSQPLREEELKAWQGLVRVLGHELNNSLAPIKSIAGSLGTTLRREARPPDWEDDLRSGLDIIATRAEGLERFLQAYSRLARIPPPVARSLRAHRARAACQRAGDAPAPDAGRRPPAAPALRRGPGRAGAHQPGEKRRPMRRWSSAAPGGATPVSASAGGATGPWPRSGSKTTAPASRRPPTSSCLSSPRSPPAPASASCSAARSQKITAARSTCATARARGCVAILRLPLPTRSVWALSRFWDGSVPLAA